MPGKRCSMAVPALLLPLLLLTGACHTAPPPDNTYERIAAPQADSGQAATGAAPRSQTRSPTCPASGPGPAPRAGQGRP